MTDSQQRLARKYITYRTFTSLWFIGAVWLYFYRIFITDQQVGILDGAAFAIGLLAEVPSGALADKFGKDKIARLGQILAGSGLLIQAAGSSFMPFFVGQTIMMIGIAFLSGADEALFFQKLKFDRQSPQWRQLVTRGSQIGLIAALCATIAGGWLYAVNPRLPWVLNGLAFLAAAVVIWTVKDERAMRVRQKFFTELNDYLRDIKTGFAQFGLPKLRIYVAFILTVQGLFYATGYGLLRLVLLDRFQFDPFWGSVAIASSSLITVGVLAYMHKHANDLSEKRILVTIGCVSASSLLLSLADIGAWGYIVILALYVGEYVLHPFMSEILNNHAPDEQRATVLSVASFLKSLPYIFLAPLIGYLNTNGTLEYFLITWAILIFVAVFFYVSAKRGDTHIALIE